MSAIAALLRPFVELSPQLLTQTSRYQELLLQWNAKINLTAVRKPEKIITRHFGESFFAAKLLFPESRRETVIDVGSGAGFPGLPLAMFVPEAELTLIEADGKKAVFLNEVIRALGLRNAKVFNHRAETYTSAAGLVTMRAVEKFDRTLAVALGLVRPGGRIALMIGVAQLAQTESFGGIVAWERPQTMPGGTARVLLVGTKRVQESCG
jgi:16S rRNA (guanine527-N7)-methyltransferase